MLAGWIKLYRDIQDHWIWQDPLRLKWWIDLLLLANYKEGKTLINGELVTIEAGEHLTSELKLAERWGVSRGRVHRFLQLLENDGMITQEKGRQNGTTVKVSNYGLYQTFSATEYATDNTTVDTSDGQPTIQRAVHKQEEYKKNEEAEKERSSRDDEPPTKKNRQRQPKKPLKTQYAEFVSMTNDEYSSLVTKIGEQGAARCVEILDNYKGANGKKYASDYRAILNWVIKRYEEEQARPQTSHGKSQTNVGQRETVNERNNRLLDEFFGKGEDIDGAGTTPLIERCLDKLQ